MNTLLGELATLNDIQYPRYRMSFKIRKLQKSLLLDHIDVGTLQEALHLSGVGVLGRNDTMSVSQLRGAVTELYSCLRVLRPVLGSAQIQQAEQLCSNWLQMNYQCSTGGKAEAGSLKVTLCLLIGAKPQDKARYMFSVLANSNGAVECCDLAYYCTVTQQLAGTLQEELYSKWAGPEKLWRECLVFVRSAEDVEDDELDGGGIRRQWLSQFEFTKLFTSDPAFLNWLSLYHQMPSMEKVVHQVRCAICTRKPVVAFRYQCTQCSNFNLCQMCFLKGRVTDKHTAEHQMMEFQFTSKGGQKSWHHRLTGGSGKPRGGRVWDEPMALFVYSPRTSVSLSNHGNNQTDAPMQAIADMLSSSQQSKTLNSSGTNHTHKPTMIRIGSGESLPLKPLPQKQAPPTSSHQKRSSVSTTSSSSPDSLSSSGGKFIYEAPLSSASSGEPFSASNIHTSPAHMTKAVSSVVPVNKPRSYSQHERKPASPQRDLTEINRKLSLELDMLLNDLPPPSSYGTATLPAKLPTHTIPMGIPVSVVTPSGEEEPLHNLQFQEEALEGQVTNLTNKRKQLAGELEGLISQVHGIQEKSMRLGRAVRTPSPSAYQISPLVGPSHSRADSLPAEAYLNPTPSPPTVSPLLTRKMHSPQHHTTTLHGSHMMLSPAATSFHDPMVEYKPTDLDWNPNNLHPEGHRVSLVW